MKTAIITKSKEVMSKFALSAVIFAEQTLGSGAGQAKKELAIGFLLGKLPLYLKPFRGIIQNILGGFIDQLIEKAVVKLQEIQANTSALAG